MEKKKEYTLYKWRWLIMLGYCLISTGVAQSNVSFVAVSNILQKYYRINIFAVNILTLLYTATVLLFTFPFAFLLHRYELAVVMKLSAVLNVIGTVVRYFAANQNGYIYLVTGSVLSAFAFTGYAFIPAKLAGNWFGEKEIGLATSICIGVDVLNAGLGFLAATSMIKNSDSMDIIGDGIQKFVLYQLIVAIVAVIFVIIFVKSHPPTPPSLHEEQRQKLKYVGNRKVEKDEIQLQENKIEDNVTVEQEIKTQQNQLQTSKDLETLVNPSETMPIIETPDRKISKTILRKSLIVCETMPVSDTPNNKRNKSIFRKSLIDLLKNKHFILILIMMAISQTIEILFQALLNQMLIYKFKGKEQTIGVVGCVAVVLGFFTNIIAGIIIDKTKEYKKVSTIIFIISGISGIVWSILLEKSDSFIGIVITFCILISVNTSYYSVGVAHCTALMHPICPGTIGMVILVSGAATILSVVFLGTYLLKTFGAMSTNIMGLSLIFISCICSLIVRNSNNNTHDIEQSEDQVALRPL